MTLWSGGRFDETPADIAWRYTVDHSDRRLLAIDVAGSLAHAAMLHERGLLSDEDHDAIVAGLQQILAAARDGSFEWLDTDEDVHSAVERRLVELVGEPGRRLHTGRSRNDQIALDLRLYLREACDLQAGRLAAFASDLAAQAETHAATIVPFYTHLQQAQAVPLGHHLLAHAWAAVRSRSRFLDLRSRLDVSPLGAGAGGGTSLQLDPASPARDLGFSGVFPNSIDAVGARDLVAEFAWCCAQAMVDVSRLAEELVLWASSEFGWVTFPDAFTTGSSAMPQKKNPDLAELARGRSAGVIGDLVALLALQKGLPLAYNRDLQEDKRHVFGADDVLAGTLEALTAMIAAAEFAPPPPDAWVTALDLAEALVERGVPFRDAHHAVGRLVAGLIAGGRTLVDATAADLVGADERFTPGDVSRIDPASSVAARRSPGGGSVESVHRQVAALRDALGS
jgi:argininosuccinate lyase